MLGTGHPPLQSPATITLQTAAFAPYFALRHQQQQQEVDLHTSRVGQGLEVTVAVCTDNPPL